MFEFRQIGFPFNLIKKIGDLISIHSYISLEVEKLAGWVTGQIGLIREQVFNLYIINDLNMITKSKTITIIIYKFHRKISEVVCYKIHFEDFSPV